MTQPVVGEPVLQKVSHSFAIPPDFERTDAGIPIACTVCVGIVAIGTDGIGFSPLSFRVVEHLADLMVLAWITCKDVDADREDSTPEPGCGGPITIAIVGTGDEGDVFPQVEHIIVLISEVAEIVP